MPVHGLMETAQLRNLKRRAERAGGMAGAMSPKGSAAPRSWRRRCSRRYGAAIEPIGFAMDRRMLLGVQERAERRA
jgi:hypothetical protein